MPRATSGRQAVGGELDPNSELGEICRPSPRSSRTLAWWRWMRATTDERIHLAESLTLLRELGDRWLTAFALEQSGGLAAARAAGLVNAQPGDFQAARLFGAAEALRETLAAPRLTRYRDHYQRGVAAARTQFDGATFAAAWAAGRALTLEQAIAESLKATSSAAVHSQPSTTI